MGTIAPAGGIDCDIHPSVPNLHALLPYLEDHWRDMVIARGMDELNSISYPAHSPLTARADWRPGEGKPAATLDWRSLLVAFAAGIIVAIFGQWQYHEIRRRREK